MKIIKDTRLNSPKNNSRFESFSTKQKMLNHIEKQDTIGARAMGKYSPSPLKYDSFEAFSAVVGAFGTAYLPYLLIKKVPQKENWSKFSTNFVKAGIPICAYNLVDSLSYIIKGKRLFELLKKENSQ